MPRALRDFVRRRGRIVGINRRNVQLVYPHNPRIDYCLADDKLLTKERMFRAGVPVPETLVACADLREIAGALAVIEEQTDFVVKPARSSGGQGIIVVEKRLSPGRWRRAGGAEIDAAELRYHLANIIYGAFSRDRADRACVERRIRPHPFLETLWAEGLSDIRVLALEAEPILAMMRVPTSSSQGRANLHQGAVGLAIDIDTGRTCRAWHLGAPVSRHPDTGRALLGTEVPVWNDILAVARSAAGAVPLGYLGVDLVLDASATPLVLELNARPGLEIQNVHGRGLGACLEGI
jgi:alpha-L-glutamate ligase-like protein